jgi:hypothetical protein
MPLFNDSQLQGFGNLLQKLGYKDNCQIKRPTTAPSDYGETEELIVIAECQGMRKKPSGASNSLQLYADRLGSLNIWQISLPKGQDVQEGDIITIDGDDMKVQILLKQTWDVSREVIASEVS